MIFTVCPGMQTNLYYCFNKVRLVEAGAYTKKYINPLLTYTFVVI